MNKRIKNIVTVVLLAAFLFGFGAWAALKPADSLSLSERRRLKQLPAVRMDAVLSGKFMSDFEGYALDQFPLRDEWRTLKALNQLYVYRQKDNNGVYIKDGYAAKLEYPMNESSIDHAAERFRYLYENFMADAGARVHLRHPRQELLSRGDERLSRHRLRSLRRGSAGADGLRAVYRPLRSADAGRLLPHGLPLAAGKAARRGSVPRA